MTQIYILVQAGTSMSTFSFHFQSVSGPQPNVVVASDLNEYSSLHIIVQSSFPERLLHEILPFVGC